MTSSKWLRKAALDDGDLVAALRVLQRPFARLELHDRGPTEKTVLRSRRIASLDEIVSDRITSRRAWWDGLKLFWTRYEFLDLELTSGEHLETRRYWRYEAHPVLGSDLTRAADELRSHLHGPAAPAEFADTKARAIERTSSTPLGAQRTVRLTAGRAELTEAAAVPRPHTSPLRIPTTQRNR